MDLTPNKALELVVIDLGGSKAVAPLIWPDKGITEAARLLCDCLNDERPAKLDFSQVLFILRLAKDKGIHRGMDYIADDLGYSRPEPIAPKEELAELLKRFFAADESRDGLKAEILKVIPAALKAVS